MMAIGSNIIDNYNDLARYLTLLTMETLVIIKEIASDAYGVYCEGDKHYLEGKDD